MNFGQGCDSVSTFYTKSNAHLLFPKAFISKEQKAYIFYQLQQCYNPQIFNENLAHSIYRCHLEQITNFYKKFKNEGKIQLNEPHISSFFSNETFPNLQKLQQYFQKKEKYPYQHVGIVPQKLQDLINQVYVQYRFIPNYERILLFFPKYLQKHLELQKSLFEVEIISNQIAYFIAFCAAAQLGCFYFMNRMLKKFKQCHGEISWITQGSYPKKLVALLDLNRKMARSIWQINPETLQKVMNVGDFHPRQLIHLCQLIVYTHNMCTIALSMGLIEQQKCSQLQLAQIKTQRQQFIQKHFPSNQQQRIEDILKSAKHYHQKQCLKNNWKKVVKNDLCTESNQRIYKSGKDLKKHYRLLQSEAKIKNYMKQISKQLNSHNLYQALHNSLNVILPYQNNHKKEQQSYRPIKHSQFNFSLFAYPILNNIIGETFQCFTSMLNYSFQVSKYQDIATSGFKKAVRYYSQNLMRIRHQQYDYHRNVKDYLQKFENYLSMELKFHIRLLTLSPFHITKQVISEANFLNNEVGCLDNAHLSILIGSTKMQSAMTMIIKALECCQEI